MHERHFLPGFLVLTAVPVSLAQESLCNPCVDPPTNIVSPIPEASPKLPLPGESPSGMSTDDLLTDFGLEVSGLRGLNTSTRTIVVVDRSEEEEESTEASAESEVDSDTSVAPLKKREE